MMSDREAVIGDGSVALRRAGRCAPIVAQVRGPERSPGGEIARRWRARRVPRSEKERTGARSVRGAVGALVARHRIGLAGAVDRPPESP
jgi:hypothetical protein